MKRIAILGSTGSIGKSTLSIVESFPDRFSVVSMAAGNNVELAFEQARRWRPQTLSMASAEAASQVQDKLNKAGFLSSLDRYAEVRRLVESSYSGAALNLVQVQPAPARAVAECEAVARLRWNTGTAIHMLNPEGLAQSPQLSQIALIGAPKIILGKLGR